MRTTVPHPRPAPRERSRPASFCPAPVASAFAPPAPVSAAPAVPPSPPLLPSSSSLSRTPDKVRVRTVRAAVPHPHPAPREWSRPGIFLPGSCRFSLRPSGPRFRRSPTPAVLPSSPLLPSSSSLSRTPDKVRVCTVHAAVPHPRPAPRERSRPTSFCPVFAPPAPVSAASQLRPFHRPRRSVPSSPSLTRTPDRARIRSMRTTVPHPRPAPRERSRPTSFCPVFAPPAPVSAASQLRPFHRPRRSVPSSPSLSRTPDRVRFRSVRAAVPHPRRNPGNGPARHLSVRPLSLRPSPRRPAEPAAPSARHAKRAV